MQKKIKLPLFILVSMENVFNELKNLGIKHYVCVIIAEFEPTKNHEL